MAQCWSQSIYFCIILLQSLCGFRNGYLMHLQAVSLEYNAIIVAFCSVKISFGWQKLNTDILATHFGTALKCNIQNVQDTRNCNTHLP